MWYSLGRQTEMTQALAAQAKVKTVFPCIFVTNLVPRRVSFSLKNIHSIYAFASLLFCHKEAFTCMSCIYLTCNLKQSSSYPGLPQFLSEKQEPQIKNVMWNYHVLLSSFLHVTPVKTLACFFFSPLSPPKPPATGFSVQYKLSQGGQHKALSPQRHASFCSFSRWSVR